MRQGSVAATPGPFLCAGLSRKQREFRSENGGNPRPSSFPARLTLSMRKVMARLRAEEQDGAPMDLVIFDALTSNGSNGSNGSHVKSF